MLYLVVVLAWLNLSHAFRFLSIGDWGDSKNTRGSGLARFFEQEAKNAPLALFLGDNFYPAGVKSWKDDQFQSTYLDVFNGKNSAKMFFLVTAGNVR